ncbi:hypothetical protein C8Q76DRAFT_802596 [Earliella scabrosa]|nr:hypothetical protein C8Q76DRAFT_802596 [Earliella scabrosa]
MSVAPAVDAPSSEFTVTVKCDRSVDHPAIMQDITLAAYDAQQRCVAQLCVRQIDREPSRVRGDFLRVMDKSSTPELRTMAQILFDKYGRLKSEHVEHGYHRGTGVWGHELDNGTLILILSVRVAALSSGTRMISLLLQALSSYAPGEAYLLVRPVLIEPTVNQKQDDAAVHPFHEISFRRVGRTSFVAFSVDPRHPSRRLSIENDVHEHITPDYPPTPSGEGDEDVIHVLQLLIRTADTNSFMDASAMDRIIRELYAILPVLVNWKDELGCKPLHVAARFCNLTAVRTLLSLLPEQVILQQLADRDNREGLTPLESCERVQRSARERQETSSFWIGYSDDALRIIYLLRCAAGEALDVSEDAFVRANRYGCTCGQCTMGWLTPRMRHRIQATADTLSDYIDESIEFAHGGALAERLFTIQFLERFRRITFTKAFCEGYAAVVRTIAEQLTIPGVLPLPSSIRATALALRVAIVFFVRGGVVQDALRSVLLYAMAHSPLGNGYWDKNEAQLAVDGFKPAVHYATLPTCENDLNFALVAMKMGLKPEEFVPELCYCGGGFGV